MTSPIHPVCELKDVWFTYRNGTWPGGETVGPAALRGVSLSVPKGHSIAIVGESGSGKSTLGAILIGMQRPTRGDALYFGESFAGMKRRRWRGLRGKVPVVPQSATQALNPRIRLGMQVLEPLLIQTPGQRPWLLRDRLDAALEAVDLPCDIATRFPRQVSGGQRQRILIARALISEPDVILFDEATTALDAITKVQVLRLIRDIKQRSDVAIVFITHDLSAARSIADTVFVLKDGQIVESGPTEQIFQHPTAHYTRDLIDALPPLTTNGLLGAGQ